MCDYEVDPADVWVETRPEARREYRCTECMCPIARGARHVRVACLADHEWSTIRYHEDCGDLRKHVNDGHCGGEPYAPYELREAVAEHYRDEPALLGRWAAILRARRREAML